MAPMAKAEEGSNTWQTEQQTGRNQVDQAESDTEITFGAGHGQAEGRIEPAEIDTAVAASTTDTVEPRQVLRRPSEQQDDEDARRNRRARANALMDAESLNLLKLFNEHKTFYVEDLSERLDRLTDWLKIALLVRADFIEVLGSTVRVTPDGLAAWKQLDALRSRPAGSE